MLFPVSLEFLAQGREVTDTTLQAGVSQVSVVSNNVEMISVVTDTNPTGSQPGIGKVSDVICMK